MSGGFRWLELGIHQVVANEDGRILCHIIVDSHARKSPIQAYVDGKMIGMYIDAKSARAACEEAISTKVSLSLMNAGRIHKEELA